MDPAISNESAAKTGAPVLMVEDIFCIEGRGVMLVGSVGESWDKLKQGHRIIAFADANDREGRCFWVKDCERFRKGYSGPGRNAAILLRDQWRKDAVEKHVTRGSSVFLLPDST